MGAIERKAKSGDKDAAKIYAVYELLKKHLEAGNSARSLSLEKDQVNYVAELNLLTIKPVLYLCNVDENSVVTGNEYVEKLKSSVAGENAELLSLGDGIEADISELDSFEERQLFLEDLGLEEEIEIQMRSH